MVEKIAVNLSFLWKWCSFSVLMLLKFSVCFCYFACCFQCVQVWIYFVMLGNCHDYCIPVFMLVSSRKLSLNSTSPLSFLLLPPGLWFDIGTSLSSLSLSLLYFTSYFFILFFRTFLQIYLQVQEFAPQLCLIFYLLHPLNFLIVLTIYSIQKFLCLFQICLFIFLILSC